MKNKVMGLKEACAKIKDGDTVMFSGFNTFGVALDVADELLRQGRRGLTVISNDGGLGGRGLFRLVDAGRVRKFICSFCGPTPSLFAHSLAGEVELELCPQGSLAERCRAGGYGLGGILTKTGLGTIVEEKWGRRVCVGGEDWLYQAPLRADVAVLEAWESDESGNLIFKNTQRNFATVMAYAAELVIASVVNPIVKPGGLDPERIMVPGVVVDCLVREGG